MSEDKTIDAASHFNRAVESTAVVGGLVADRAAMKEDISEIKADAKETREDVKHIRSRIDNWAGRSFIVGTIISFAASVAVAIWGQPLAKAIASLIAQP